MDQQPNYAYALNARVAEDEHAASEGGTAGDKNRRRQQKQVNRASRTEEEPAEQQSSEEYDVCQPRQTAGKRVPSADQRVSPTTNDDDTAQDRHRTRSCIGIDLNCSGTHSEEKH